MKNSVTASESLLSNKTNYTQDTRSLANRSVIVLTPANWKSNIIVVRTFIVKPMPQLGFKRLTTLLSKIPNLSY